MTSPVGMVCTDGVQSTSVATRVGEGSEPCGPWGPPRELIYLTPNRLSQ